VRHENYHPSHYNFTWLAPTHNGAFRSNPLNAISDPLRVEWDDYDIEIIKTAQRVDGLEPIKNLSEAKMLAWEMFLFAADERICQLPQVVRHMVYLSLDPESPLESRMKLQEEVCRYFHDTQSNFGSRWEQIRPYYDPSQYACWFAELIAQMRDQNYRRDFSDLQSVA
jgi:hypothetical protein